MKTIDKENIPDTLKCFACKDSQAEKRWSITDESLTFLVCLCSYCAALDDTVLLSRLYNER